MIIISIESSGISFNIFSLSPQWILLTYPEILASLISVLVSILYLVPALRISLSFRSFTFRSLPSNFAFGYFRSVRFPGGCRLGLLH